MPQPTIDLEALTTHLTALAATQACPECVVAASAVAADVAALLVTLARLYDELAAARLEAANLRAAIHAALGARADGEDDPLAYLRWELPEHESPGFGEGWSA